MSKELADQLRNLDMQDVDVTDPQEMARIMGYDQETFEDAPQPTSQGDTAALTAPEAKADVPAPEAAVTAVESSATPAAAVEKPGEIAGVLTKDGKHIIPYSRLQGERERASLDRQRAEDLAAKNEELIKQVEDLKAGRTAAVEGAAYTPEQLEELERDFPQLAPLLRTVEHLQKQSASAPQTPQTRTDARQVAEQEADAANALDVAIAPRPLLSKYRETGGVVWDRAVEIDTQLMADPAFNTLSMTDRFAKVEERLAAELGMSLPNTSSTQTPSAPAASSVPAVAKPSQPTPILPTLTDLGGGSVAVGDPMAGMTSGQMVDKAMTMDMEALRKMAGLAY